MKDGKRFTIERLTSGERLAPADVERLESLLATIIAKAIIDERLPPASTATNSDGRDGENGLLADEFMGFNTVH